LKTPARNALELPSIDMAVAVAAEWDAQSEKTRGIQPVNMPMMSLASTAIDQVQESSEESVNTCMRYLPTDAALFITGDTDRILLAKQKQYLFPVIDWFKKDLQLELGTMVENMAGRINHPPGVAQKIEAIIRRMVRNHSRVCLGL
jgi:chaperone required for assembly of F1-ATPase